MQTTRKLNSRPHPASVEIGPSDQARNAILRTLAYSDVFDYPLSAAELHRYLIGVAASPEDVHAALNDSLPLEQKENWFAIRGRATLFESRRRRQARSARLWRAARAAGRIIAHLPFVRMVAVTGALAANNVERGADVDYLIVTARGRLWLCRAFVLALRRLAAPFGIVICPNYLLAEDALELPDRNLFTAQELARMVPLSGMRVYTRMRALNAWTNEHLPNSAGAPARVTSNAFPLLQRLIEAPFNSKLGDRLEQWEMRRKVARLTKQGAGNAEAHFTASVCKGHFDRHNQRVMIAYAERLKELGL